MSPRAAWRLESLGFKHVFDYVAGKADWGSAGLRLDGENPSSRRAGAYIRADVPTCALSDRVGDVRQRVSANGWDVCFVVNDQRIVLGMLGRHALHSDDDAPAGQVMTPGPSTIRPSARLEATVERMRRQDLTGLPVTTSDGRLVGWLPRDQAERHCTENVHSQPNEPQ